MKKTLASAVAILVLGGFACGIAFYTSAESTPTLIVVQAGISQEMAPLHNDWWWSETTLKPGEYDYYFQIEGIDLPDFKNPDRRVVDGREVSRVRLESLSLEADSVKHVIGERDYFNPVREGEIYLALSLPAGGEYSVSLLSNGRTYRLDYLRDFGKVSFYRTGPLELEKLDYSFRIETPGETFYLDGGGLGREPTFPFHFDPPALPLPYWDVPDWSKGTLYYQIFPDRFANGERANDPENSQSWDTPPEEGELGGDGFFGGDLEGIAEHFDHLLSLGVEALYLNPIFESPSSHKYDTRDYMSVDDNLGGEEALGQLLELIVASDMKLILDGVFNHTGYDFFAFRDLRERGEQSPYADWYFIKRFPIKKIRDRAMSYVGWNGYAHMPKVNALNPDWQEYVKGVVEKYALEGVGGWRLDAAAEVAPAFWSDFFNPLTRGLDEEMILIAEYWGEARNLLGADAFASLTNYPFRDAVTEYLFRAGNSAAKFVAMTNFYLNYYPPQTLHSLWNILDSHDTERILTLAFNRVELLKIALALQFTFIGSPVIYYGDEVGMKGGKDPQNRAPMIWEREEWNWEIYDYYRRLIQLRSDHPSLVRGEYEVLSSEGPVLIYARRSEGDEVYVCLNPSRESAPFASPLEGEFTENLSGESVTLQGSGSIPPLSVWILSESASRE